MLEDLYSKGFRYGIFGDIDLEEHLIWIQNVCKKRDIIPLHPIWKQPRQNLIQELFTNHFDIKIIAVKQGILDPSFLGKTLNQEIINDFDKMGIDLCGEKGEYHTMVVNGPCFKNPIVFELGDISLRDEVWFIDVIPKNTLSAKM